MVCSMINDFLKNISRLGFITVNNLYSYFLNSKLIKGPLFVNWDITHKCNSRCIFCDRWKIKKEDLSTEDKIKIIRELGKTKVWMLSLCGGEPLLVENLELILKEIKKQGMLINISTNGLLLKEKSELLVKSKVDFITVSIQGHTEKIHDSIVGINGAFKKVKNGINSIKKMRKEKNFPKIYARVVLNRLTLDYFDDFLDYWSRRVDKIILQPISSSSKMLFKIPKKMKFLESDKKKFENYYQTLKKYNQAILYNKLIPKYLFHKKELRRQMKCFSGYFFLTLDAEGNLYSCSARKEKLGNLMKNKFMDLLKSKKMTKFKSIIRNRENKCICWHSGSMINLYLSLL